MSAWPADPSAPVSPPAWCLPAGALLALATLVPFLPGFLEAERAEARAQASLEARDRTAEERAASTLLSLRVFAIGDSMLRSAVWPDEQMRREGRAYGLDLTWRLFGRAGRTWDSAAVVEAAAAARPDLLIVESSKLFYTPRSEWPPRVPLLLYRPYVQDRPPGASRFIRYVRSVLKPEVDAARTLRAYQAARSRMYAAPDDRYLRAFEDARRGGTQVVLVEIPVHPGARSALAEPEQTERWLRRLEAEGALLVWRCALPVEADEFVDFRHLEPRGRSRYSRWLLERVSEWRDAQRPRPDGRTAAAR